MNIQEEKSALIKLILNTENTSILYLIKKILKKDFWDSLPEAKRNEILREIESGKEIDILYFINNHKE